MADTYANFADLAAHEVYGVDYNIEVSDVPGARIMCLAVHGGGIEPGSTECAYELSRIGRPRKFYSFNGTKGPGLNGTLHITSTNFDEPQAVAAVADAYRCVSMHGYFDVIPGEQVCYMGGLDTILRERIAEHLNAAGIIAVPAPAEVQGKQSTNIANTTRLDGGVQLEMTRSLRDSFFVGGADTLASRQNKTAAFWIFLGAVNAAILEVEMGKQTGIGDQLWIDGVDLTGDTGSLQRIAGGPAALDLTDITQAGYDREGGLRTGAIDFTSWFNPARAHPQYKTLPRTDRIVTYARGSAVGNAAASMVGMQIGYDPTRGADGSLSMAVQALSNGYGLEWGVQALAGKQTTTITDTAADAYGRVTASGLGTADTGGAYTTSGGVAGDYSTDGSVATIILSTVNVTRRGILGVSIADVDITVDVTFNQASTGGFVAGGLHARWVDSNNNLALRLEASSSGSALNVTLAKVVAGSTTNLVNGLSTGLTYTPGTAYKIRFLLVGDRRAIKVWAAAGTEPTAWLSDTTDADLVAAGGLGIRAIASSANTNVNPTVSFDNLRAMAPIRGLAVDTLVSRSFGLQLYYQLFAYTGSQLLVWLEQSSDDGVADPWAEVPGSFVGPVTAAAPYSVRVATSDTATIERYVRVGVSTSTGLSAVTHAVVVVKNETATVF